MEFIRFGIEFETCFCQKDDGGVKYTGNCSGYAAKLREIARDTVEFTYSYDPGEDTDYTTWLATTDGSIRCKNKDEDDVVSEIVYTYKDDLTDCHYNPVELVSPIIGLSKESYDKFKTTLTDVILNPVFQYQSNESQGMHVNVSHPMQDKLCMLKLWWYFEPVILQFIPVIRRNSRYVKTVRSVFTMIEDIESGWEEYYQLPDKKPAKYMTLCVKENRFEFRLVNANMNADHVKAWVGLCSHLVYLSTLNTAVPRRNTEDDIALLFQELFRDDYVNDPALKAYFSNVMTQYDAYDGAYNSEEYNEIYRVSKLLHTSVEFDLHTYELLLRYKFMDEGSIFIRMLRVEKNPIFLNDFLLKYKSNIIYKYVVFNNFLLIQQNKELFDDYSFSIEPIDILLNIIIQSGYDDEYDNYTLQYHLFAAGSYTHNDCDNLEMIQFLFKINPYGNENLSNALIAGFKHPDIGFNQKFDKNEGFKSNIQIELAAELIPNSQKKEMLDEFREFGDYQLKEAAEYLKRQIKRELPPKPQRPKVISFEVNKFIDFSRKDKNRILYLSRKTLTELNNIECICAAKVNNTIVSMGYLNQHIPENILSKTNIPRNQWKGYKFQYSDRVSNIRLSVEILKRLLTVINPNMIYGFVRELDEFIREKTVLEMVGFEEVGSTCLYKYTGNKQFKDVPEIERELERQRQLEIDFEIEQYNKRVYDNMPIEFKYTFKNYLDLSIELQHRLYQVNKDVNNSCELFGIAQYANLVVCVSSLKKSDSNSNEFLEQAGIEDLDNYVLQYVHNYTDEDYVNKSLENNILKGLLKRVDPSTVYSIVKEDEVLESNGFVRVGNPVNNLVVYKHL